MRSPEMAALLFAVLSACAGAAERSAAPRAPNCVVLFLDGAELQIEAEDQLDNLRSGLDDLATQPIEVLRARRYRDYQGTADQWTLPELLERHFVPGAPRGLGDCFWSDAPTGAARAVARRWRRHLDERVRGTLVQPPP